MQSNTFRLFISSTFSDFKKEREILHTRVFPRIDKYCIEQGFSFQPIDLRWGVNNEAQLDQKTLEVCLKEVKACKHFPHPNFLIMAGDRYGYIPLPYMIEKKELELLRDYISKSNKPLPIIYKPQKDKDDNIISHKEPRQTTSLELLDEWYKEDENQIPLEDENSTAYILQPRRDDYVTYVNWEAEENALRKMLQEAAKNTLDKSTPAYQKYFTSATEAEAIEGITEYGPQTTAQKEMGNTMDKEYVFGYLRTIDNPSGDYVDQEKSLKPSRAKTFKKNLRNTLLDKNIHPARYESVEECESSNFEAFEEYFYEHLKRAIDKQKEQTDSLTSLQKELAEQQKFKNDKLKGFLGREKTLSSISNYLDKETIEQPLIIYGPSGMGKSSLMAKAIEEAEQSLSNAHIFYRFVGATQGSTTLRALLTSICDELQEKEIIAPIESYESEENKFQAQIKEALSSIKAPTILFIDALDQLQKKDYLQWLPESLPDELKIVLTVLKDSKYKKDSHYFNLFEKRAQISQLINIAQDSLEPKKEELLTSLLLSENRKLQEDRKSHVLEQWQKAEYSPLYLKIAIEEIKNWSSYGDRKKQILSESTEGIINEFIENLSSLYHHERILVDKVFGYIHASKDGLSEKELLEILSEDLEDEEAFKKAIINDYHDPIKTKNPRREHKEELMLPLSTWSRLHTHIKPFLVEKDIDKQPLMKFFHRQFAAVVEEHISQNKRALHVKLGEYFSSLQDTTKTWDKRYHDVHMLTELPYQYHMAEEAKKLKEILFDLEFAGAVHDNHKQTNFREILEKASSLEDITEDEIHPWESFYREKEHLIVKVDEELWRPRQSLFQLAYEDGLNSPLTKKAERLLEKDRVDFAWLKRRNRPEGYNRSGLIRVLTGHTGEIHGVIEISSNSLLSWSEDGTVRIWNIEEKGRGESRLVWCYSDPVAGAKELSRKRIVFWSKEKDFLVWQENKGVQIYRGHERQISGVVEIEGNILSFSDDNTLILWGDYGNILNIFNDHDGWILGTIVLSDNSILSWSSDETLRLWSLETNHPIVFQGHADIIYGAIELQNGNLLSWSHDSKLILWDKSGRNLAILKGHKKEVNGAIELRNGNLLSWSSDGKLIIWSKEGNIIKQLLGSSGSVSGAIELQNGNLLSWSEEEFVARLWSNDGEYIVDLVGHEDNILGILELSDGDIISYSDDCSIIKWSDKGNILGRFKHHGDSIKDVLELTDRILLSWSYDNTIKLFNSHTSFSNSSIFYHSEDSYDKNEIPNREDNKIQELKQKVIILKNGNILSWSNDKTLKMWNKKGECLTTFKGHQHQIIGAKELEDGTIVSWSWSVLMTWSQEGVSLATFTGHGNMSIKEIYCPRVVQNLSWSNDKNHRVWKPTGETLIFQPKKTEKKSNIILKDGAILLSKKDAVEADNEEGVHLATFTGHGNMSIKEIYCPRVVQNLSWSNDKNHRVWKPTGETLIFQPKKTEKKSNIILKDGAILLKTDGFTLTIIETTNNIKKQLIGHLGSIIGFCELDNGDIISWAIDKSLKIWNRNGICLSTMFGHSRLIKGFKEFKNGNILSWSNDETLRIWNRKGECLKILEGHLSAIEGVIILKNGNILSWSNDKTLKMWNKKGECLTTFKGHQHQIIGAKELEDGTIVSWSEISLRIWGEKGNCLVILTQLDPLIRGFNELQDGNIVTWATDETLRIWNRKGECLKILEGHLSAIEGVIILKNGNILSWSNDKTLKMWNKKGECLTTFKGHQHQIIGAKELEDGTIVSWSDDETIRIWGECAKTVQLFHFTTESLNVLNTGDNLVINNEDFLLSDLFIGSKPLFDRNQYIKEPQ